MVAEGFFVVEYRVVEKRITWKGRAQTQLDSKL